MAAELLMRSSNSVCWLQVKLSGKIKEFIQESTGNYGKAKLVLQKNKFFVESAYPDVLKILLQVGIASDGPTRPADNILQAKA